MDTRDLNFEYSLNSVRYFDFQNSLPKDKFLYLITGSFGDIVTSLFTIKHVNNPNDCIFLISDVNLNFFKKYLDSSFTLISLSEQSIF